MTDNLQRASVTLQISGDDLVPSELTELLGREPTLGVRKGERFLATHGREIEAKSGMWNLGRGYLSPPDLDGQISSLLQELPKDFAIWRELTARFECWLSVGGYFEDWTGGFSFKPSTLSLLVERDLPIDFDLYAEVVSS